MDAVKFIEERRRMYQLGCIKHAINDYSTKAETVVAEVEQWSKEHPRRTRQSVFLEQYPEASISGHGVLLVCPCLISASHRNAQGGCVNNRQCSDCRKDFWGQEVE